MRQADVGEAQFQLVFEFRPTSGLGTYTLNLGSGHSTDGVVGAGGGFLGSLDASVAVFGSAPGTALLLCFAGLAGTRTRSCTLPSARRLPNSRPTEER
jgi:hypothetical protein